MPADDRAPELAALAVALADGHGIELPDDLALWELAGGRPTEVPPRDDEQPWHVLGRALEEGLDAEIRRLGAHYTPPAVATQVARLALPDGTEPGAVVDPACGGGALLLEAAERLVVLGATRTDVARDLLWGADVDPLPIAVSEAAITLWARGTRPEPGHLVVDDALSRERVHLWPTAPPSGFAAVVGNPPFQGQLATDTMRDDLRRQDLRQRFGPAAGGYVDTATVFVLAAMGLAAPGARVAMVQPQSVVGARDAAAARAVIGRQATLVEVVDLPSRSFDAHVEVCVIVLEVVAPGDSPPWVFVHAAGRGIPIVDLGNGATVASIADAVAGFRQHYYALVGHVHERDIAPVCAWYRPLVTCGAIDIGATTWGVRATRFAKQRWHEPVVDVDSLAAADPTIGDWFERLRRPKVLVASQTRVTEAAADHDGGAIPGVPAIAVIPTDREDVDRLAAALCAPPVAAWAARRASGTGMSRDSIRVSAALLLDVPLPIDVAGWDEATRLLVAGDLRSFGRAATAMYGLPPDTTEHVLTWWAVARTKR